MNLKLNLPLIGGILVITTVFLAAAFTRYTGGEPPRAVDLSKPEAVEEQPATPEPATQAGKPSAIEQFEDSVRDLAQKAETMPATTSSSSDSGNDLQARIEAVDSKLADLGLKPPPVQRTPTPQQVRLEQLQARLQQLRQP